MFNALLKRQAALAASYPFATVEPNIGIVDIPDDRLEELLVIANNEYRSSKETQKNLSGQTSKEITVMPATIKFIDIAGLVEGAHQGEGLGNQFLAHIREVDAVLHLLRGFDDENVSRAGSVSPQKDVEIISTELLLADLQTVQKRLDSKKFRQDQQILNFLKDNLERGNLISKLEISEEEQVYVDEMQLITSKPILYALNVSEDKITEDHEEKYIVICAKLEEDLIDFSGKDRGEYLGEMGIEESGLNKIIKECYELLGLETFFSYGPKEVRAWTFKKGTVAEKAAGIIHSDFERGFIKAEVISFSELAKFSSWKEAKEKGQIRLEGKQYVMQEGDVVQFRFNV